MYACNVSADSAVPGHFWITFNRWTKKRIVSRIGNYCKVYMPTAYFKWIYI